jgi:hypothetical protein
LPAVATLVLRVWLPDRPGALGAVASRIGAVHGDVIGIDIIERGAGRAVDELVVDLPEEGLVDLLLAEVGHVEGVDVEDVRLLDGPPDDPTVVALQLAAALRSHGPEERLPMLVAGARQILHADWAAVVDLAGGGVLVSEGDRTPGDGWLTAFVQGALTDGGPADLHELAVARLGESGPALVVGRDSVPLRASEREVLVLIAHLA